jgi:undecaprenyl-diphosphatase
MAAGGMPLLHLVVLAALQGVSQALPISPSGHAAAARLWLETPVSPRALAAFLELGATVAIGVAVRVRLLAALGEGVRAIARPALFRQSPAAWDAAFVTTAVVASALCAWAVRGRTELLQASPVAVGLGLLVSGLALASTGLAPAPRADASPAREPRARSRAPGLLGAALVGAAHGLAVFPGASRVGAALTVLLWLGVRPGRSLELAFLVTLPAMVAAFFQDGFAGEASDAPFDFAAIAVGFVVAFAAATAAVSLLRSLLMRRRVASLALWMIPLGLALLAYARALPAS